MVWALQQWSAHTCIRRTCDATSTARRSPLPARTVVGPLRGRPGIRTLPRGPLSAPVHHEPRPPGDPRPVPHQPLFSFGLMEHAPGGPSAQFNAERAHHARSRSTPWLEALVSRARTRTRSGVLREYGGWLGVWNCETGSRCSPSRACPTSCPRRSAAATTASSTATSATRSSQGRPVLDLIVGARSPRRWC